MSMEESERFRKSTPENIIPSDMLDKWKPQDDGRMMAKSRNVLIGWKDPMIYHLEGIMIMLQWIASSKVSGRIASLRSAFGQ